MLDVKRVVSYHLDKTKYLRKFIRLLVAFGKKSKGQAISVQGLSKGIKLCIQICYDLAGITAPEGLGDQFVRQREASEGTARHVHAFLNFSRQLVLISCCFSNQIQAGFTFAL